MDREEAAVLIAASSAEPVSKEEADRIATYLTSKEDRS